MPVPSNSHTTRSYPAWCPTRTTPMPPRSPPRSGNVGDASASSENPAAGTPRRSSRGSGVGATGWSTGPAGAPSRGGRARGCGAPARAGSSSTPRGRGRPTSRRTASRPSCWAHGDLLLRRYRRSRPVPARAAPRVSPRTPRATGTRAASGILAPWTPTCATPSSPRAATDPRGADRGPRPPLGRRPVQAVGLLDDARALGRHRHRRESSPTPRPRSSGP